MNLFATTFLKRFTLSLNGKGGLQRAPLVDLPEYGDAPKPATRTLSTISAGSLSTSATSTSSSRSPSDPQVKIEIPLSPLEPPATTKKKLHEPGPVPCPRGKTISRLGRTVLFYLVYFACLFSFLSLFLGAFFYLLSRGLVYLEEQHRAAMLAEAQGRSAEAAAAALDGDLLILDGSVSNESSWSGIPLDVLEAP